jgi:prefoldin subunit 5
MMMNAKLHKEQLELALKCIENKLSNLAKERLKLQEELQLLKQTT